MSTAYDWITVMIFAALVTRFLASSAAAEDREDSLWHYLLASGGCAAANWLGNEGHHAAAIALIVVSLAYIYWFILRPAGTPPSH
jgi:hypothetical protein